MVSGISHSTGLRYVRISNSATTRAVVPSNRKLAPSKTLARSALMPAGPVTWAVSPVGRSSPSTFRISATFSRATVVEVPSTMSVLTAAVPSWDGIAGPAALTPAMLPAAASRPLA